MRRCPPCPAADWLCLWPTLADALLWLQRNSIAHTSDGKAMKKAGRPPTLLPAELVLPCLSHEVLLQSSLTPSTAARQASCSPRLYNAPAHDLLSLVSLQRLCLSRAHTP